MERRFISICFFLFCIHGLLLSQTVCKSDSIKILLNDFVVDKKAVEFQGDLPSINLKNSDSYIVEGIVYVLNSDCSFCVINFLDFISALQKKTSSINLYAIIEDGDIPVVEFYMKKAQVEKYSKLNFIENTNEKFLKGRVEDYGGLVFNYYEDRIKDCILYENNR